MAALSARGPRLLLPLLGVRALHTSQGNPAAKVAVVLSGCGVYDGTEIHEASAILVHLSRAGAVVKMFAPDIPQMHVIDHTKGEASQESRLCCIAPVLAAKVIPGVEVTVGQEEEQGGKWPYAGTAKAIQALGGKHCPKEVHEVHVDKSRNVVTTPAFMGHVALHTIFDGIGAMVSNVIKLTGK
ncbi:hypothetical protein GDO78_015313 [Eleutherodactylus coqui]|uniref:ES1 protein homolog, mitochondrial n=1 Tax=Eleutherodactylus coqui TaxID=57060 RepID=A0A8J6EQ67_ELECQ|nr:hypothetical protein GDO78_015313 [Eleutherodactylus coqui]